MQKTGTRWKKNWPGILRAGWLAGALLVSFLLTSCGNTETQEGAENPGSGKHWRPEIVEGFKLLREKDYEKAMSAVFSLIAKDPYDAEALSVMGWIYVKQDRLQDASKLANRSLQIDPHQSLPYTVLARVHFQTSSFNDSLELARKALLINPKDSRAYQVIGEIYLRKGLNKDALAVLKEAVKLEPHDPETLNILGSGYIKDKQYDQAMSILLATREIDPDLPGMHFNLALVYTHLQDGKKAMKHINRAEQLYTQEENKPWMAKARDVRRVIVKKFKFTPDDVAS